MKYLLVTFFLIFLFNKSVSQITWAIEPKFDYHVVNCSGSDYKIPPSKFKEGVARITFNNKDFVIDKSGKLLFEFGSILYCMDYGQDITFSEGLLKIRTKHDKVGFIDKSGKIIIREEFEDSGNFSSERAQIEKDKKWGYIDKSGRVIIPPIYNGGCGPFSEGLAPVSKDYGSWGFIDKEGKTVIPFIYQYAGVFSEGLTNVRKDGKWGFIDKEGKTVIPFIYDACGSFSEGLASIKKNGKCGFINNLGEVVVPMQFDYVYEFAEGLCVVKNNDKCGFIDKNGKIILPIEYDEVNNFSEGLAWVKQNNKWGAIQNPLIDSNKPTFTWLSPLFHVKFTSEKKYTVSVIVSHSVKSIDNLQLYQNNKLLNNRDMFIEEANTSQSKTLNQQVLLEEGLNTFHAVCEVAGKKYVSSPVIITYTIPKTQPTTPVLATEKRLALVLSNANYTRSGISLPNPNNDSRAMKKVLEEVGFDVILAQDLSKEAFEVKVNEFSQRLKQYDVGLFYFAGHGMEVDKNNYLMPVDVPRKESFSKADVPFKCISTDWIHSKMAEAGEENKSYIMILDACRNNPFSRSWGRDYSFDNIWAPNQAIPSGFITCFAASQGEKASDSDGNENGLFTSTLLKYIKQPNLQIESLFKLVRLELKKKGGQEPEYIPKLNKEFYFVK